MREKRWRITVRIKRLTVGRAWGLPTAAASPTLALQFSALTAHEPIRYQQSVDSIGARRRVCRLFERIEPESRPFAALRVTGCGPGPYSWSGRSDAVPTKLDSSALPSVCPSL